jgi:hypothetical protein
VASSPANKPPEVSFDNCPSEIVPEVFSAMQNSENHFIYSCRLKVKDDSPSVKCGITCQGKYSLLKVDNFPYSAKLKLGEYCGPCPVTGDNVEIKARCTDTGELSGRDLAKIPLKKMDLLSIEPPPAPKTSACGSRYTIPEFEKPENWSEYHCATSGCSCEDIIKKEKKLVKKGCYYLKEYSTSAFRKEHNQIDCYLCCPPGVE